MQQWIMWEQTVGVERWKYYAEAEIAGLENAAQDKILNVICRQFLSFIAESSATFPCSYLLKQCSVAIASHTHTHPLLALCPGLPG